MYAADGTVNPALGVRGGESGALCRPYMRTAEGELVELDAWAHVMLQPGETMVSVSSAGGGYGPAHERDPERVRHDIVDGWVSAERARRSTAWCSLRRGALTPMAPHSVGLR